MVPFLARGAGQSIEDAFVPARSFAADRDDPQRAIEAYAPRRRERTARIQNASREAGQLVQLMDAAEIAARNARLGSGAEAPIARSDWIWSYEVERVMVKGPGLDDRVITGTG